MTEVAKIERHSQAVAEPQEKLISMIERVALNPELPIERLEKMLDLKERMDAKAAEAQFNAAFAAMQAELPEVPQRGKITVNNKVQSTYPLFEDIVAAARPVMAEHGFGLSHKSRVENGEMIVTGILSHIGGHSRADEVSLPFDTSGSKNATQARGSSIQYGKRYTTCNLLLIASRGEDDGGVGAGRGPSTITDVQFITLRDKLEKSGMDPVKFFRAMGSRDPESATLEEFPANLYDNAMKRLDAYIAKKGAA